jgi:hypothetical protein
LLVRRSVCAVSGNALQLDVIRLAPAPEAAIHGRTANRQHGSDQGRDSAVEKPGWAMFDETLRAGDLTCASHRRAPVAITITLRG